MNDRATLFAEMNMLVAELYAAMDENREADAAALFLPDGYWLRKGERLEGPEAILAVISERDPARRTRHNISNLRILSSEGDTCRFAFTISVYADLVANEKDLPQPEIANVYDARDSARLTDAGWRLAAHEAHIRFKRA